MTVRWVDAADVLYSLDRTQAIGQAFAFLFAGLTATAVDDRTVRLTLPEPNAAFLATLPRLSIVNSDLAKANQQDGDFGENGDYSAAFLSGSDAGSGAYWVDSHNMQELTILKAFPDYFEPFDPLAPETIRVRYGLEAATHGARSCPRASTTCRANGIPTETYAGLADNDKVALTTEKGVGYVVLPINTQKPPTDDVHFRRAMVYALDYDAFANIVKVTDDLSAGIPARTAIPRAMFGYDSDAPAFKQDLDRARAELAQVEVRRHPRRLRGRGSPGSRRFRSRKRPCCSCSMTLPRSASSPRSPRTRGCGSPTAPPPSRRRRTSVC